MKKLLTLLLTLLTLLAIVGCGSNGIEEQPIDVPIAEVNEPETKIEEPVVTENIETKDEESVDPTQYSYWVVFKNPDGNELQRTIEKYGTTPVYTGDTPTYWDSENWYRFTNWDKELKPITGNTYITAEYEFGGELKQEKDEPAPTPSNLVTVTFAIGDSPDSYMTEKDVSSPHISQLKFLIGTNFTISGQEITINGVTYELHIDTLHESFDHWEYNGTRTTSGGVISENCTIRVATMPA